MPFDQSEDDIGGADRSEVAGDVRADFKVAISARHAQSARLHGLQMRTACEQHDIGARLGEFRADIATDRPGPCDNNPHASYAGGANAAATTRRWILPVAVRGIAVVMWICFGRLKSASRSLQ